MANLIPTVNPKYAVFRGPSSSADFNSFSRAAYNDIVAAYAALQVQLENSQLANEVLSIQYQAALTQLSNLQQQIQGLQQNFTTVSTFSSPTSSTQGLVTLVQSLYGANVSYGGFPSFYPVTAPLGGQSRAAYEPMYGQILPASSVGPVSKAYIVDLLTQDIVQPPGVITTSGTTVTPTVTPFATEENDLGNAVDGSASTFWRRNVYFPTNTHISNVSTVVTLTIPNQFVNNLQCNYVTIHPYPEFSLDIESVILYGAPGTATQQLLQYDIFGNIIPITGAGKTRLLFPSTQVVSIDITLSQSHGNSAQRPGLKCFTLGAAVLDFGFISLSQNPSQVLVPFTLSNNFFQFVASVSPIIPGVNYSLYYLNTAGDLQPFTLGQTLPAYVSTIYVDVTLQPTVGQFPYINSLQIQYSPVYQGQA